MIRRAVSTNFAKNTANNPLSDGAFTGIRYPLKFALVLSCLLLSRSALASSACALETTEQTHKTHQTNLVRVQRVVDGDTIWLTDGRKVRIIGIDTPELGHQKAPDEPLARKASTALRDLLEQAGNQVILRADIEAKDRYQRDLAHVYLSDGTNLSAWQLQAGHASVMLIPPNTRNLDCYLDIEQLARQQRAGIWALPQHKILDAASLPDDSHGFHIIHAKIERISYGGGATWINLVGGMSLQVRDSDGHYFDPGWAQKLRGVNIEARGFIYRSRGQWRMRLRHPLSIKTTNAR